MSVSSVCVCVCLSVRDHIFGTTRPTNFLHVFCDSVLRRRRSDMLCTFGIMDDLFRALKVTSEVATTGAESAVYDCLIFWLIH